MSAKIPLSFAKETTSRIDALIKELKAYGASESELFSGLSYAAAALLMNAVLSGRSLNQDAMLKDFMPAHKKTKRVVRHGKTLYKVLHSRSWRTCMMWPKKMTNLTSSTPFQMGKISPYETKSSILSAFKECIASKDSPDLWVGKVEAYEPQITRITFEMIKPLSEK